MPGEKEQIRKTAETLLRSAVFTGTSLAQEARLHAPIPIIDDSGKLHSWFVAVLLKQTIAGFFQVDKNNKLIRYAAFPQKNDSSEAYPDAALWTDAAVVLKHAKKLAEDDETLSEPVLSFDGNPSRLAWAVHVDKKPQKIIYVTGEFVYLKENLAG